MTILFISTPLGKTLSIAATSLDELKNSIHLQTGFPIEIQKFHYGGKCIDEFLNLTDLCTITLFFGLEGGKGGFGSLLRNQAQTRRKITNWDHSRDREGRRIGNIKNENNLVDFFKRRKEEEMKIQKEIEQVRIQQATLQQNQVDMRLDQEYKDKLERTEKMIEKSVAIAKLRKGTKVESKKDKIPKELLDFIDDALKEQQSEE